MDGTSRYGEKMIALADQLEQVEIKNQTPMRKVAASLKDATKLPSNNGTNRDTDQSKWSWKAVNPKANKPGTNTVDDKNYWLCPWHKKFVLHNATVCSLQQTEGENVPNPRDTNP